MNTAIEKTDIPVESQPFSAKSFPKNNGYPANLTADQVTRLIYFFGARKLSTKMNVKPGKKGVNPTQTTEFTSMEKRFLEDCFTWFGIVYYNPTQFAGGYRAVISKFKGIMDFLRERPAFITPSIYQALKTGGYGSVLKPVVLVMNENRELVVRLSGGKPNVKPIPLHQMETLMWEFQNTTMDKLMLIVQSITPADIKKANLGIKSKALRDLYSVIHMARLATKNPNQTLIGININSSSPGEKMRAVTSYVIKNREQKQ